MRRSAYILFKTLCATVVAVAIWTVALLLNLVHWILGDGPLVREAAWALVVLSTVGFWILFYRHFARTVPRETPIDWE